MLRALLYRLSGVNIHRISLMALIWLYKSYNLSYGFVFVVLVTCHLVDILSCRLEGRGDTHR